MKLPKIEGIHWIYIDVDSQIYNVHLINYVGLDILYFTCKNI